MRSVFLSLSFLLCGVIYGQNAQSLVLDSLFTVLHNKNSFNGNVLIADKGEVLFEKSYGLANEENKTALNLQTKFELASVSKQFTAMGIVLLAKQGKLSYDDKVSKYIPELAFYENISIRNLLNHTGGLPDYMALLEDNWDKSKFVTNQDIVDEFAKHKPAIVFPPNEEFEYSNTGYALLGLIIERVSDKTFGQFLKEYIFKPLNMEDTFVYRSRYNPEKIENYANGYVLDSLGKKVLPDSFGKSYFNYYLDGIVGDGMVNSTVGDLLKWDRALYTEELINQEDKKLIFSTVNTLNDEETNYGFGWFITESENYGKIVGHSGSWAGYITFIERHITNDKTVILLQNNALPSTKLPIKKIRNILYGEPITGDKPIELNSEDLDKYLGVYSNEDFPLKITVSKKEHVLITQATGQNELPMDAYENHIFKYEPAGIKLIFNPEEESFHLSQGGLRAIFKKE